MRSPVRGGLRSELIPPKVENRYEPDHPESTIAGRHMGSVTRIVFLWAMVKPGKLLQMVDIKHEGQGHGWLA